MAPRPRHQEPDYEKVFKDAERRGWTIVKAKRHFQARCPGGHPEHTTTVSATPGSRYTLIKVIGQLKRCGNDPS